MVCRSTTPPAEIACLVAGFFDELEVIGLSLPVVHQNNGSGNPDLCHYLTPDRSKLYVAFNNLRPPRSVRNEPDRPSFTMPIDHTLRSQRAPFSVGMWS